MFVSYSRGNFRIPFLMFSVLKENSNLTFLMSFWESVSSISLVF